MKRKPIVEICTTILGRYVALALLALLASGCVRMLVQTTPPPPTSVGLYPDSPTNAKLGKWKDYGTTARNYSFTYDEVFEATESALLRLGLASEESNPVAGKINGSGWWPRSCNPAMNVYTSATWVVYVKAVSPEVTRVTARVDSHGWNCSNPRLLSQASQEIHAEIVKVLATY